MYPLPGGTWCATEAEFKKACKTRGINPKALRGVRDVPTGKAELLEFLNFNAVDVYRTGDAEVSTTTTDAPNVMTVEQLEALRLTHNPDG